MADWRKTLDMISSNLATNFKVFTRDELQRATNNYHEYWIVGEGTNSVIYRGILDDQTVVAVTKFKPKDELTSENFRTKICMLSTINHAHVIKLLGWRLEMKVLVLEYIPNGKILHDLIFERGDEFAVFPLSTRLRIAAETAEALAHMLTETYPPIYHGNVSSRNILLDADYTVKLFEVGDPIREILFNACDVSSFGRVLLELLCGKFYKSSLFDCMRQDRVLGMLDPAITSQGFTAQLRKVIKLAAECWRSGKNITMKEVHRELEASIRLSNDTNNSRETTILHSGIIGVDTRPVMKKRSANKVDDTSGTISIGLWRYQHEYWFDDESIFDHSGYDGIRMIIIYCSYPDAKVNSIRIQYTKRGELEWTEKVGEDEGERFEIVLDEPGEYITKVSGYTCLFAERSRLCSLTIITNRQTYSPFGQNKQILKENWWDYIPFQYSGGKLVGFKGTSARYISSLGFYVQYLPQSCEIDGGKNISMSTSSAEIKQVPFKIRQISVETFGFHHFGKVVNHGGYEYDGIKRIFINYDDYIDYFQVEYVKNGQPEMTDVIGYDKYKDKATEVVLDYPNEFLQAVTGSYFVTFYDHTVGVTSLTFHSNLKKYGPFGYECGQSLAVSGGKIVGFRGIRTTYQLCGIGFHVISGK